MTIDIIDSCRMHLLNLGGLKIAMQRAIYELVVPVYQCQLYRSCPAAAKLAPHAQRRCRDGIADPVALLEWPGLKLHVTPLARR